MSNISGKLNLLNLHGVVKMIKGQLGEVECLVIPLEKNKLFKGKSGIYLDIIAFEIAPDKRKADSKDTHLVKQSFDKAVLDAMTDEAKKALPLLGSLQVWGEHKESAPISSPETQKAEDDLPFN